MIRVSAVHSGSIAAELGLQAGTELLSVDGRELEDFLDWEFLTAEERILLHVRQPDGEEVEYDIERPLGEPIGVSLEPARIRRCANRCDFCFVDGLPDGLRDVLYIRDDDYRLSFRYGNFATLTNLKPHDVDRVEAWFARHGTKTVLLGRMVPVFRVLISVPAGIERMPVGAFVLYTAIGSVLWNTAFVLAGYLLGANWRVVEEYGGLVTKAIVALTALVVGWFVVARLRRRTAGRHGVVRR